MTLKQFNSKYQSSITNGNEVRTLWIDKNKKPFVTVYHNISAYNRIKDRGIIKPMQSKYGYTLKQAYSALYVGYGK